MSDPNRNEDAYTVLERALAYDNCKQRAEALEAALEQERAEKAELVAKLAEAQEAVDHYWPRCNLLEDEAQRVIDTRHDLGGGLAQVELTHLRALEKALSGQSSERHEAKEAVVKAAKECRDTFDYRKIWEALDRLAKLEQSNV